MIEANNSDHNSGKSDSGHHNGKPSYLQWVFIFGGIAIAGLLAASIWWPHLTERTKFFTGNLLNLIIALAVIAQGLIYRRQWDAMQEALDQNERVSTDHREDMLLQTRVMVGQAETMQKSLENSFLQTQGMQRQLEEMVRQNKRLEESEARARAINEPRLRVAEVTAETFMTGERPFYVVTIANDGLLAATDVRIHMSIQINDQTPMDWINEVVVTIPANGKEHHFIHSSMSLSQDQLESFESGKDSLRVVGFFEHAPVGRIPFCYKYQPLQGEARPPKIPQFVDCDYTPRLNTTLQIQPGYFKMTGSSIGLIHGKADTKPDEGDNGGKDENEKGNPN